MEGQIDKRILGTFLVLLVLVIVISGLYFSQYLIGLIIGSVYETVNDQVTITLSANNPFTADNVTARSLGHSSIVYGSLNITDGTNELPLSTFIIDYSAGTARLRK